MNIRTLYLLFMTSLLVTGMLLPYESVGQRKRVGLVLSGGGAKGVAHINAIKVIEEAGIPIDYIAGTSMGAIIGGLYSIGYDTDVLDSMVRTQNWTELLSDRVSRRDLSYGAKEVKEKYLFTIPLTVAKKLKLPSGLVGGNNVYNLLYELTINYHDSISFDRLPVPFRCVAFDLVTGHAVVLDEGFLPDAIRASMSIPGAFQPVDKGDMLLIDGGIGNNFPADVARSMGAEIIIGVDVTSPMKTKEDIKSLTDVFDQITSFTGLESYEENMQLIDVYIRPDIEPYNAASFSENAIDSLLNRGEVAARSKWDELIALKEKIGIPEDYIPERRPSIQNRRRIFISDIQFEGLKYQSEKPLRKIIGIREHSQITSDDLQNAVSRLQGTNTLSDVHYRLDGKSPYSLTFIVREKSRNTLSLGFSFDTEEMAGLLLNVTLAGKNMNNSYFDITGKLANNPFVKGSYIIGNETKHKVEFSYMFRYRDLNVYRRGKKSTNLEFDNHRVSVGFTNITVRNFKVDIGMRYDYFHYRSMLSSRLLPVRIKSESLVSYFVNTHLETIDSRYYPKRGVSFNVDYSLVTNNLVTYRKDTPYSTIQADFLAAFSLSKRVTLLPGFFGRTIVGKQYAYSSLNFMGGALSGRYLPQQISFVGIHNMEQFEKTVVGLRFDLRVRLWQKNYVSLKTNYAKHDGDFFNVFRGKDVFGVGLNYSYNSLLGPIDLLVDYSGYTRKPGIYFNFGYYF